MAKINYTAPEWVENYVESYNMTTYDLPEKKGEKLRTINTAIEILDEYEAQGYQLTLRQLYYQFVSRDLIPNTMASYKKLGTIISDGRMWGLIDWDQLVDRGRNFDERSHWDSPADIIEAVSRQYSLDRWEDSDTRFEVWVEKDALSEIVSRACRPYDVGYIACKGYMSMSEMWAAAQRLKEFSHQECIILHLGDHDPSGIDMTRDIQDRLNTFGCDVDVRRIALNMDQVDHYNPPPNPTKITDTRAKDYIENFGTESWELDALEPKVITALIKDILEDHVDEAYNDAFMREENCRELLGKCSSNWDDVVDFLEKK